MDKKKHDAIRPVPDGYATVAPWVITRDTRQLLDFVRAAFGAEVLGVVPNEDGTIGHAEFRIGDTIVLAFDSREGWPPTPAYLRLYIPDGDAVYARALAAGATSVTTMTTQLFGDRGGRVRDPFGNIWWIQTHIEDIPQDELERRMAALSSAGAGQWSQAMRYAQQSLDSEMRSRTGS